LTPGRYVGAEEEEGDTEEFEEKMNRLTAELVKQMEQGDDINREIRNNLRSIGYGE
jgi:type I restriction enzyme M protein